MEVSFFLEGQSEDADPIGFEENSPIVPVMGSTVRITTYDDAKGYLTTEYLAINVITLFAFEHGAPAAEVILRPTGKVDFLRDLDKG